MSLANLHWYGWITLCFAMSSTLGAIWEGAAEIAMLHAGLKKQISCAFLIPATLITLTLLQLAN